MEILNKTKQNTQKVLILEFIIQAHFPEIKWHYEWKKPIIYLGKLTHTSQVKILEFED